MLKKLLTTYSDKVDGQEAVSNKKAELIYAALEAHIDAYRIVPDKSVRSRMNICFRVTKVSRTIQTESRVSTTDQTRVAMSMRPRRPFSSSQLTWGSSD